MTSNLTRRGMIAAAAMAAPGLAFAQGKPLLAPANSILNGRIFGPDAQPNTYPDPDVLILDKSAEEIFIGHASLKRLGTNYQWAEGPAWSNEGQYLVFSDVMGDVQYRLIWETMQITPFRRPSFNSNGNTFDFQGRQVSGQDFPRRVVRWEHDGSMTVLADSYNGQPLNSPNDFAPHPDGSIWFSDPYYGSRLSEGHPDDGPGPTDPKGLANNKIGNPGSGLLGGRHQTLPGAIYRIDANGTITQVLAGKIPNGLAFSPDYKKLYYVWGPSLMVADVEGGKLANPRLFSDGMVDGVKCGFDGHRVDVAGNVWSGSTAPLGYAGVTVWNPAGKCIGRIRLPETCANVCFCGPKRDWLFMCASQSVYLLRLNIQGAAPA
jgi:gluconolactonase